jgi:hypothetical protein
LVPEEKPPTNMSEHSEQTRPSQQAFPKKAVGTELDDDWIKLLADIRSK